MYSYIYIFLFLSVYIFYDTCLNRHFYEYRNKNYHLAEEYSNLWHNLSLLLIGIGCAPVLLYKHIDPINLLSIPFMHSLYFLLHETIVNYYGNKKNPFHIGNGKNDAGYKLIKLIHSYTGYNVNTIKMYMHFSYIAAALLILILSKEIGLIWEVLTEMSLIRD